MHIINNGEIWHLCKLDAGGGPETRLPLGFIEICLSEGIRWSVSQYIDSIAVQNGYTIYGRVRNPKNQYL